MTCGSAKINNQPVVTFHTDCLIFGLLQVLLSDLQVKIELSVLLLEFGKFGDELTGFLKSINVTLVNRIKGYSLPSEKNSQTTVKSNIQQ